MVAHDQKTFMLFFFHFSITADTHHVQTFVKYGILNINCLTLLISHFFIKNKTSKKISNLIILKSFL